MTKEEREGRNPESKFEDAKFLRKRKENQIGEMVTDEINQRFFRARLLMMEGDLDTIYI